MTNLIKNEKFSEALHNLVSGRFSIANEEVTFHDGDTLPSDVEIQAELDRLQAKNPMQLLRAERDRKLKEEVDPKTCEAYNNGTQLSTDWKNYRQALLDMTLQTPTLDENGNLKAGLELDEIYWPTKPE